MRLHLILLILDAIILLTYPLIYIANKVRLLLKLRQ